MDRDDLAILEAARAQDINLRKTADGMWEVAPLVRVEPLSVETARQADTFLSGDRIRYADGREFKRLMTTAEVREVLGLDQATGEGG